MAVIVIYDPADSDVPNRVTKYLPSANTPDYDGEPNKLVNPDLSSVSGIHPIFWKRDSSSIIEMTAVEKNKITKYNPVGEYQADKDILVYNNTGSLIKKGTPVYNAGSESISGQDLIGESNAGDPTKLPVIGILNNDLPDNKTGTARFLGDIDNIDTSMWEKNNALYIDSTCGLTNIRPDSSIYYTQQVGYVKKSGINGKIFCTIGSVYDPAPKGTHIVVATIVKQSFTTTWSNSDIPTKSNGVNISSLIITPKEASSKIKLEIQFNWGISNNKQSLISFWRGNMLIGVFGMAGRNKAFLNDTFLSHVDSANTTDAITYYAYAHINSATLYIGQNKNGQDLGGSLGLACEFRAIEMRAE